MQHIRDYAPLLLLATAMAAKWRPAELVEVIVAIDLIQGSMFIEEAGLDMAPNMDRQADLLATVVRIKAGDFQHVLSGRAVEGSASAQSGVEPLLPLGNRFDDPQSFLLAVMNDPAARAEHRIAAAQALLPYFAKAL